MHTYWLRTRVWGVTGRASRRRISFSPVGESTYSVIRYRARLPALERRTADMRAPKER
jgi:hypothetical protein